MYDYIFAGTGIAAILLLNEIVSSPLKDKKVLLIDKLLKEKDDRTICFWDEGDLLSENLAELVSTSWKKVEVSGVDWRKQEDLAPYQYKCINSHKFYEHLHQLMLKNGKINFIKAKISSTKKLGNFCEVMTDQGPFSGKYVFNSIFDSEILKISSNLLLQHFSGWVIETNKDAFDPSTFKLFDFDVPLDSGNPQASDFRFIYVLPYSTKRALVEVVSLKPLDANKILQEYLKDNLDLLEYKVLFTEKGINPLTTKNFDRRSGERVINIGVAGGMIKPSSGYAFTRMLADAKAIAKSMMKFDGKPKVFRRKKLVFTLLDYLLIKILNNNPAAGVTIFTNMLRKSSTSRVFKFLDEQSSLLEILQIMLSCNPRLMISELLRSI